MNIDLNVDLGEGGAHDAELIRLATSVNIACGGHAGDLETMRHTVELAQGKSIGAHPGYEDRENFGRLPLDLSPEEITESVARQIRALAALTPLHHVKPHGALYNQAQTDPVIAQAIIEGVLRVLPQTIVYTLPHGELSKAAHAADQLVHGEGFIDRGYQPNGQLIPRDQIDALITDPAQALAQTKCLAAREDIQTLCVHGDSKGALEILRMAREGFSENF